MMFCYLSAFACGQLHRETNYAVPYPTLNYLFLPTAYLQTAVYKGHENFLINYSSFFHTQI